METVFRPGGKHAIGFGRPFGDQVIDQNTDIGIGTFQNNGFLPSNVKRGIDPGH